MLCIGAAVSCENVYSALFVEPMENQFIIQGDR